MTSADGSPVSHILNISSERGDKVGNNDPYPYM